MSTFLNCTFQSFNLRARQKARPLYDLIANIAAEEFGHIELVSGCRCEVDDDRSGASDVREPRSGDGRLAWRCERRCGRLSHVPMIRERRRAMRLPLARAVP